MLHRLHQSARIRRSGTAKLRGALRAHGHSKRLRRFAAKISPSIHKPYAVGYVIVIIVVMLSPPTVVGKSSIKQFTVNLQPSVRKRNVLKIMKSDFHPRHRPSVGAVHEVAARQSVAKHSRAGLFHPDASFDRAIFYFAIQASKHHPRRMTIDGVPCRRLNVEPFIRNRRRIPGLHSYTVTIAEPRTDIQGLMHVQLGHAIPSLSDFAMPIGSKKIWREFTACTRCRKRSLIYNSITGSCIR